MPSLQDLPIEIQTMVLRSLHSLEDLSNCVRASKILYQTFQASQALLTITKLATEISPAARSHAISLQDLARLRPYADANVVGWLLRKHFAREAANFLSDLSHFSIPSLMEIRQRHRRLMKFVRHFASHALSFDVADRAKNGGLPFWSALNEKHQYEYQALENNIKLSSVETARLQRAFYAHELYCEAVPICSISEGGSFLTKEQQYTWFWEKLPPFQAEEIAYVHQYFIIMAGILFDQIELELVEDFLAASESVANSAMAMPTAIDAHPHSESDMRTHSSTSTDFVPFKSYSSLHYLYPYFRRQIPAGRAQLDASLLASRGTEYFTKVLRAPKDVRRQFLKDNFGRKRVSDLSAMNFVETFRSEAFDEWYSVHRDSATSGVIPSDPNTDDEISANSTQHSQSWYVVYNMPTVSTEYSYQLHVTENDTEDQGEESLMKGTVERSNYSDQSIAEDPYSANKAWDDYYANCESLSLLDYDFRPYRDVGCVFWDAKRLAMGDFTCMVRRVERRYGDTNVSDWPRSEVGADSRLRGITINRNTMVDIIEKYCPTMLLGTRQELQLHRL